MDPCPVVLQRLNELEPPFGEGVAPVSAAVLPVVSEPRRTRAVGLRDIPVALLNPRRFFHRVEDVAAYAWPLVVLLTATLAIGWATVETGLVDREQESLVQKQIAELEKQQLDVVERSALTRQIQEQREAGEFFRLIARLQAIALAPMGTLATVLLLAAVFYGLVALTGRKPEWHTLVTIFLFAAFAGVMGELVRLGMMLAYGRLDVDTSLAVLTRVVPVETAIFRPQLAAAAEGALSAFDPFRIWFWIIAAVGLTTTAQLRGWRAWTACFILWFGAAGLRAAVAAASAAGAAAA